MFVRALIGASSLGGMVLAQTNVFTPDLFDFLRQLKRHNDREWFARHKARYEQVVRDPALAFIGGFAPHLWKLSPHFLADARPSGGSLFRIYRDTRFSSDQRPFKTHVGIRFRHESGKNVHAPVFYLHLEPGNCFAAAGVWHPDFQVLTRIRAAIATNPDAWRQVRRKLELEGDILSRPPRGFDPHHEFIDDIKFKDFISSVVFSDKQVCGPRFMRDFERACRSLRPLVEFTTRALGLKV